MLTFAPPVAFAPLPLGLINPLHPFTPLSVSENICAVCLTRAKHCPDDAVKIVKLPTNMVTDTTHHYGPNCFKIHGLPTPRPGHVLGLLGTNGIGKSTVINVLAGRLKPNLGELEDAPGWLDIIKYYRGSDLQNFFTQQLEDNLKVATKPQLEASLVKRLAGKCVREVLTARDERGCLAECAERLQLTHLLDREIQLLSGGELQRFVICATAVADRDLYLFDEPSSFLDVRQRLAASELIRSLVEPGTYRGDGVSESEAARIASSKYVVVVEHDLTILDYMSDYVCPIYGVPGAYGVVAKRCTTASGVNQFLAGYISADNVRFRAEEISFRESVNGDEDAAAPAKTESTAKGAGGRKKGKGGAETKGDDGEDDEDKEGEMAAFSRLDKARAGGHPYPAMSKTLTNKTGTSFTLHVEPGEVYPREVRFMRVVFTFTVSVATHIHIAHCTLHIAHMAFFTFSETT